MATIHAQTRALLRQYVDALTDGLDHRRSLLYLCGGDVLEPNSEATFAKKTWIHADVCNASSSTELQDQLRAFIALVSQLSAASRELTWREYHHSFWKSALMDKLGRCAVCRPLSTSSPTEYDDAEKLAKSDGPRFLLDFSNVQGSKDGGDEELGLLRDLLCQKKGTEHEDLLSQLTLSSCRSPIELGVVLSRKQSTALTQLRVLAELMKTAAEQENEPPFSNDGGNQRVRYEVTTLLLVVPAQDGEPFDLDAIADLLVFEASTIRHLRIADILMQIAEPRGVQSFQRLLQMTSLHLENVPFTLTLLIPIYSALRYKNSFRALTLKWVLTTEADEETLGGDQSLVTTGLIWAWLASGIFQQDSDVQLDFLALLGLTPSNADLTYFMFPLVLLHSCDQLWKAEHGSLPSHVGPLIKQPTGQRVFVEVGSATTKRKLYVIPTLEATAVAPGNGPLEQEFEVAMEFSEWICVLVPGCEFRWTPGVAIVSRRTVSSKSPAVIECGTSVEAVNVTTLCLHMVAHVNLADDWQADDIDNIAYLKEFLYMVGKRIVGLEFVSQGTHVSDNDLWEILDAFPNLTHLSLMGSQLDSVASLTERYDAQQWCIEWLNICTSSQEGQVLTQIAELLEKSIPLRFLGISDRVSNAEPLTRFARAL